MFFVAVWDNRYVLGQRGLFSRAEITAMYDVTRRRNYSPAGEKFRKEHKRHRDWGLAQRYDKKLRDKFGSVEAADAYFEERAREALAPMPPESLAEQAECPVPSAGPVEPSAAPVPPAERAGLPVRPAEQAELPASPLASVEPVEPSAAPVLPAERAGLPVRPAEQAELPASPLASVEPVEPSAAPVLPAERAELPVPLAEQAELPASPLPSVEQTEPPARPEEPFVEQASAGRDGDPAPQQGTESVRRPAPTHPNRRVPQSRRRAGAPKRETIERRPVNCTFVRRYRKRVAADHYPNGPPAPES
ncbi:hypothetical protein ACPPVO_38955 [Dactylosporangium sp. McL0621]|uniref:hypothetical protein n=1 Tax=Dactylosporangium sp. McL0621 TaxID=3415678 RepID=UPI003CE6910D